MTLKVVCNPISPPLETLIVAEIIKSENKGTIIIIWDDKADNEREVSLYQENGDLLVAYTPVINRYLARTMIPELYGGHCPEAKSQVDHWLSFASFQLNTEPITNDRFEYLDHILLTRTWLVNKQLTLADIHIFCALFLKKDTILEKSCTNVIRWFRHMESLPVVKNALLLVKNNCRTHKEPQKANAADQTQRETRKQEGKFIDLPEAEMGKVVVRFPPEASGYLHIGHAKAALLNQYYADTFKGQFIMRFDDTNPAKETVEFEEAILQDLKLLQIKPDRFTHTSDYFEVLEDYCTQLIKNEKAFVDDTPAYLMKEQRDQKLPSENRDNSVEKNLALWEEMRRGSKEGQKYCVRAKIDYQSTNGCMRDPTIYRCKPEPHPRTGNKYKVYPTYDFACPIVDSIENVTHTLRTTEYHDRDAQFLWIIDALGLRRPYIWEYSRLNMTHTVLSKRKLTWFVNEGLVDGWDDPRFPTVRGILRRGMTVEGLKQFIIAQGSSRSVVFMEWDKIWAFNKKVIDPIAIRYTALDDNKLVTVNVVDAKEEWSMVLNHPKNMSKGVKAVRMGPKILIEREDAERIVVGKNVTFINWGNLMIEKIDKENGNIVNLEARLNLDDKNYKNTLKVTWLAESLPESDQNAVESNPIKCFAVYFNHIMNVPVLGKDEDFKNFVAKDTRKEVPMLGEVQLKHVKKGEIIQLQRKGFFICDVPYAPTSPYSLKEQPVILFHIPDGHTSTSRVLPEGDKAQHMKADKKVARESQESLKQTKNSISAEADRATVSNIIKSSKKESKRKKLPYDVNDDLKALHKISQETQNSSAQQKSKNIEQAKEMMKRVLSYMIQEKENRVRQMMNDYKNVAGHDWTPIQNSNNDGCATSVSDTGTKTKAKNTIVMKTPDELLQEMGNDIKYEMQMISDCKRDYKMAAGHEWKSTDAVNNATTENKNILEKDKMTDQIRKQCDKLRNLKEREVEKDIIQEEEKILNSLRNMCKYINENSNEYPVEEISEKIKTQGDKVRYLKSCTPKTDKSIIDQEVKILLSLKSDYKKATGQDWKPAGMTSAGTTNAVSTNAGSTSAGTSSKQKREDVLAEEVSEKIKTQGDKVRHLKSCTPKTDKSVIDQEVKILLSLKNDYKKATGQDWKPAGTTSAGSASTGTSSKQKREDVRKPGKTQEPKEVAKNTTSKDSDTNKTGTRLGLEVKKKENFFDWYSQVITKSGMIEYYDVSGCYILRPWSFTIWKIVKDYIDKEITSYGVQECYFPIFVTRSVLEKEKAHIADFAPEVAWVTKCGESDLAEPIAIRPTSETVMYPAYAKWLRSDTELPLKLNQWNNVVRWEFKDPKPFLRTREFLWQEGHTAFATKAEAEAEVMTILDMYARVYEDLLAVPVVKGRKTEKEKFAGGDYTTTVEAFISISGRAIQGATSHHLGQNFSKMFNIQVEGAEGDERSFVYQNSWGLTTRTIGVMIMVHGDDKGLVLPPNVASIQGIVIPCGVTKDMTEEDKQRLQEECHKLVKKLTRDGKFRVKGDFRNNRTPGWKFNHWELKGVPVRIELGPRDLERDQVTFVRRDNQQRIIAKRNEVTTSLACLLKDIQADLLSIARKDLNAHIKQVENWNDFCTELNKKNLLLTPFCGEMTCEDNIKTDSAREENNDEPGALSMGAKSLCIPFEQPKLVKPISELRCVHHNCKNRPKFYTLFGRSY